MVQRIGLTASECKKCGKRHYPPRRICPVCRQSDQKNIVLPSQGTVISFTTVNNPPTGFSSPLLIAVAEIEGVKVIGQVVGDAAKLSIGGLVTTVKDERGKVPYLLKLER